MTADFAKFKFDRDSLSGPRPPGISAYMRIKNEEQFVALSILSHLDFYDEIVAVYNGCTDNTEKILTDLAKRHPEKIKMFHYLPEVVPFWTKKHAETPTESVHSMANYSNYALSKTTYSVAAKLDADHLAIPKKLAPVIATIRKDIAAGKKKIYMFSGINIMSDKSSIISVNGNNPFAGSGDHHYHPVDEKAVYWNAPNYEKFSSDYRWSVESEYMGVVYFHLKALKNDFRPAGTEKIISFEEFCSPQFRRRLAWRLGVYKRLVSALYASETLREWKYKLTGSPPRLSEVRVARLAEHLRGIDFKKDALVALRSCIQ